MGKLYYLDFTAIEWKGNENSHIDIIPRIQNFDVLLR